jgi:molecular chaperone Hsp33
MQNIVETLTPIHSDAVVPFEVEGRDVSGRITRLDAVANNILGHQNYPDAVAKLLGQALSITALLGSIMKFEGIFTFQIKGSGPVSLLVCDYATPKGADSADAIGGILRGMAKFDADQMPASETPTMKELLGDGYLALTIDQGSHTDRYQGIVELTGDSLDDCARHYFMTSEQLPSEIVSSCERVTVDGNKTWRAASLLIQHLPPARDKIEIGAIDKATANQENWAHARALIQTVTPEELLDTGLPLQDLVYRLYHEDGVRAYQSSHLGLGCRCSRKKLEDVIRTFSDDDVAHMVVDGQITVQCQFCNTEYVFSPDEFGVGSSGAPESGR